MISIGNYCTHPVWNDLHRVAVNISDAVSQVDFKLQQMQEKVQGWNKTVTQAGLLPIANIPNSLSSIATCVCTSQGPNYKGGGGGEL